MYMKWRGIMFTRVDFVYTPVPINRQIDLDTFEVCSGIFNANKKRKKNYSAVQKPDTYGFIMNTCVFYVTYE